MSRCIGQNSKESRQVYCVTRKILCVHYRSVPWPSVRIVGTRSQWSGKHLASVPEYEVLPSKPVVGTVRQLLVCIFVQYNHLSNARVVGRWQCASTIPMTMKPYIWRLAAYCGHRRACRGGRGCSRVARPQNRKKKVFIFCTDGDMKLLRDLAYSRNQPLKSADD